MRFCTLCDTYGCPSCNWTGRASVFTRQQRVAPHLRAHAGASAYAYTAAPAVRPSAGYLHQTADAGSPPPPSVAHVPGACHVAVTAAGNTVALASDAALPSQSGVRVTDSLEQFKREEMFHDWRRGDA